MEDVGCVWVYVVACEGLCLVLGCVAGVVERIVGVLVLARSAWFVHASLRRGPERHRRTATQEGKAGDTAPEVVPGRPTQLRL